jgi:high-affinity iron transporter
MFSISLIIFREIVEISIILTILLLATENIKGRNKYISLGLMGGLVGAFLLALFTNKITELANGYGQEIVNIFILALALIMIAWTVVWMKKESLRFSKAAFEAGKKIEVGEQPKIILSLMIASSIFREGAEIVLFTQGVLAGGVVNFAFISSLLLGCVAGVIFGLAFYFGLIKFAFKHIFSFTSILLMLLASSLASQIAKNLIQADIVTMFSNPIWNSSWIVSNGSFLGQFLMNVFGYNASPSGLELSFYFTTLVVLIVLKREVNVRVTKTQKISR